MTKYLLVLLVLFSPVYSLAQSSITKDIKNQIYFIKDFGEDKDDVILGDATSVLFKPKIEITRWNKENSLKIRYDGLTGNPILSQGKLLLTGIEKEFYCYPVGDNIKFGVNFLKKPLTNKIVMYLEGWEEYNFYYQPPLTQEYKAGDKDGLIETVTEMQCLDKNGEVITERPEDVVGSYAVYHKTKSDYIVGKTNYKTGKFCHIYRPKFTDTNGISIWGDLNIKNGIYTITIPQNFLDKAKYPIVSNDTFGKTDVGGGTDTWPSTSGEWIKAASTPSSNGTLTSISAYLQDDGGSPLFNPAIYTDDGGSPSLPVTLLAGVDSGGTALNVGSGAWVTTNISYESIVSGTQYWLGVKTNPGGHKIWFDAVANAMRSKASFPATWPATASGGAYQSQKASIYATYTPASTGYGKVIIISQ